MVGLDLGGRTVGLFLCVRPSGLDLLQPRDHVNSLQLISALALIVLGLFAAAFAGGAGGGELTMVAPAFNPTPEGAPMIFPLSFHNDRLRGGERVSLPGQQRNEQQADRERAGCPFRRLREYAHGRIFGDFGHPGLRGGPWSGRDGGGKTVVGGGRVGGALMLPGGAAKGLGAKVGAFVDGSANFLMAIGLSTGVAVALMGVLVAFFAGTTLDTACRLQRYVIQEIGRTLSPQKRRVVGLSQKQARSDHFRGSSCRSNGCGSSLRGEWAIENAGKGGLLLWPLFGATNQLLAGLSFLVITFYFWRRGKPVWFLVLPMIFMLITPVWAMYHQLFTSPGWLVGETPDYLLGGIGLATIALEIWMLVEAFRLFLKAKGVLETDLAEGRSGDVGGLMVWEIVLLVVLAGAFVVLKVLHSENERKRRLERAERDLRRQGGGRWVRPQEMG